MDKAQQGWIAAHPVLFWIIVAYVLISGLMLFADIRRPLVRWYQSQTWFVSGSGPVDILFKQIGYRLSVELLAFGMACILGALGGNLYVVHRARKAKNVEDL